MTKGVKMNKTQKKRVESISYAISDLEALVEELQEQFDNRSEGWQESEKGETAQSNLDALQEYLDELQGITEPDLD